MPDLQRIDNTKLPATQLEFEIWYDPNVDDFVLVSPTLPNVKLVYLEYKGASKEGLIRAAQAKAPAANTRLELEKELQQRQQFISSISTGPTRQFR